MEEGFFYLVSIFPHGVYLLTQRIFVVKAVLLFSKEGELLSSPQILSKYTAYDILYIYDKCYKKLDGNV